MIDRFLFIQALETLRCLEEGVLTSTIDGNIGSIFRIGFPAWTGGALQSIWIEQSTNTCKRIKK